MRGGSNPDPREFHRESRVRQLPTAKLARKKLYEDSRLIVLVDSKGIVYVQDKRDKRAMIKIGSTTGELVVMAPNGRMVPISHSDIAFGRHGAKLLSEIKVYGGVNAYNPSKEG